MRAVKGEEEEPAIPATLRSSPLPFSAPQARLYSSQSERLYR